MPPAKPVHRRLGRLALLFASLSLVAVVALCLNGAAIAVGPDLAGAPAAAAPTVGPLRVSEKNPRYFCDVNGQPVYLTGLHTWNNLQDIGISDTPTAFNFDRYLDYLHAHRSNFCRLWRWEVTRWHAAGHIWRNGAIETSPGRVLSCVTHPWRRSGKQAALDGLPQFDLEAFDESYFERLRERVALAGERGIYVSIMLFEGWVLRFAADDWKHHPFHPANNINGIDGDPDGDGFATELFSATMPAIIRLQEAYVQRVIDSLNDLDNVLYEVSNENHPGSLRWQTHIADYIRRYQLTKPQQHPVGLTSTGFGGEDDTSWLFDSDVDWISPSPDRDDYRANPPASTGTKVILIDSDHLWGVGGDRAWVWKSFMMGLNPIFMDPYEGALLAAGDETLPDLESARRALRHTAYFAGQMDLARMMPQPELASTGYCLADTGTQYVVYLPYEPHALESKRIIRRARPAIRNFRSHFARKVSLDLSAAQGEFTVEWFEPVNGTTIPSTPVQGGQHLSFAAPFKGDAVLHLRSVETF